MNQPSKAKIRKAVEQAKEEQREKIRATQPRPLTWCIRAALYSLYRYKPYY